MIEDLAKLAYEFHQRAVGANTEIWNWCDLPGEAREHWRKLIGTVLDYQIERRSRTRKKRTFHGKN